jgi:hypothetical protein
MEGNGGGEGEEEWRRDGRMEERHGKAREPWGGGGTKQVTWAFYEVKSVVR